MIEAWTGRETDTSDAFEFLDLDLDLDRYLSQSEFAEHWTEFWAGDNPDAVGSYIFGAFPATAARG